MPITAVGSLVAVFDTAGSTLSVTPTAPGNALVCQFFSNTGGGVSATSLAGGGVPTTGPGSWRRVGSAYTDTAYGAVWETWLGTVAAPGASTVTITWSGSVAGASVGRNALEFTSGFGTRTLWSGDVSAGRSNASSTTVTFPTAAPTTAAPELYVGYLYVDATPAAGSTPGYTYPTNPAVGVNAWNGAVIASTAPTATQAPAGASAGIGSLITASYLPESVQPYTARRRAANF